MTIAPWQAPILVMAVIAGPTSLFWAVKWFRDRPSTTTPIPQTRDPVTIARFKMRERSRALVFAVLATILLGIFVKVLGEEATTALTAVLSAIPALVSAVLALQSVAMLQDLRNQDDRKQPKSQDGSQQPTKDVSAQDQA